MLATYRLRFGVWPRQVSPLESLPRLDSRPLLFIHGAQDPRMPVEGTERLFKRAGKPKEIWIVEGAGHLEGAGVNPRGYRARLADFFRAGLETAR